MDPIRTEVKYIAELFERTEFDPRVAIADSVFSRQYNIYVFSIAPLVTDPTNYWIIWGGWFDNPTKTGIQIRLNSFLTETFSPGNLKLLENSFYIDDANDIVYINISLNPWQYYRALSAIYTNENASFGTSPKDPNNPSDILYGIVKVEPRMEVPALNNKLSEVVSGVLVYNSFSITVDNSDSKYDGLNIRNYFNTPIQISKTSENAQTIEECNRIRFGFVYDIIVNFSTVEIVGIDQFFLMNRRYNKKFEQAAYPNLSDNEVNKDIPVGWGPLNNVPAIQIDKDTADPPLWADYIFLDPGYLTAVSAVYSDGGQSLTFSFDGNTKIVRVTSVDGDGKVIEAKSADITGFPDHSIGEIVIKALADNENMPYVEGIWDVAETNLYLGIDANVGFYFSGGTTKDLINDVLKNDLAFLILKNDGRLTIRQWGQLYGKHVIPGWVTTQEPSKNFKDASDYYCSSAQINYNKNQNSGNFETIYLDDTRERDIFEAFNRSYTAIFETDLLTEESAGDFAGRLLDRFGEIRETLSVGVGVDTFAVDLLDKLQYEAIINNRDFSDYTNWVIKEADPGQDVIVMEGLEQLDTLSFDGDFATLDGDFFGVTK